jgi:hypothetical protein
MGGFLSFDAFFEDRSYPQPRSDSRSTNWVARAVRELGVRETEMARRLKVTQPAVCIAVRREEQIAKEKGLSILGK